MFYLFSLDLSRRFLRLKISGNLILGERDYVFPLIHSLFLRKTLPWQKMSEYFLKIGLKLDKILILDKL